MRNPTRAGVYATRQHSYPGSGHVIPAAPYWYFQYFTGKKWNGWTSSTPAVPLEATSNHTDVVEWRELTPDERKRLPPEARSASSRPKKLLLAGLAAATLVGCGSDDGRPGDEAFAQRQCSQHGMAKRWSIALSGSWRQFDVLCMDGTRVYARGTL